MENKVTEMVLLKIIHNYNAGGEHGHGHPTGESLGGVADDCWGRRSQLGQCQVIPMIELVVSWGTYLFLMSCVWGSSGFHKVT